MPITGKGYELHVVRGATQTRTTGTVRARQVGTYAVYHDGIPRPGLSGTVAECAGPGDNSPNGNAHDRCVELGTYQLWTQYGMKYRTLGYNRAAAAATDHTITPRPGLELKPTGSRTEILIHPGIGFLASVGCLNLSDALPTSKVEINFASSRQRVIAVIDDLRAYVGANFPPQDGLRIPNAFIVID